MREASQLKIAIIGDIALDCAYFIKESSEASVETDLPVNIVDHYLQDGGAAANLAINVAALGAQCDVFGIIGKDSFGQILIDKLKAHHVNTEFIVRQNDFTTFVYHKIYGKDEELPRYDLGTNNQYPIEALDALLDDFRKQSATYDGIIINQQFTNSIHTTYFIKKLSSILQDIRTHIWVDARKHIIYPNASYKVSDSEAMKATGCDNVQEAAQAILNKLSAKQKAVITLGSEGAIGFGCGNHERALGINYVSRIDPVGAGDAFTAALSVSQAMGFGFHESIEFANANAAISIRAINRTGHPSFKETEELLKDPDYRYNPDIAKDIRKANYLKDTDIEIINEGVVSKYPKVAIFDHDGTISTMRYGWEKIMRQMMIEAITGSYYKTLSCDIIDSILDHIDSMIEKTTGIQTIIQMSELIEMIKEYRYVPPGEIKTPLEYKESYRKLLNKQLQRKYAYFRDGIYKAEDLTIKGALSFLLELKNNGAKAFLASGSDYSDIEFETHAIGYDHLFSGGMFGSVGDLSKDPKKVVMSNIISHIDVEPSEVAVFGDGPVEIREARKRGFLAVGVISDEHQRFGMNLAKRERLILAGADVLIPDFSWVKKLGDHLGWKNEAIK